MTGNKNYEGGINLFPKNVSVVSGEDYKSSYRINSEIFRLEDPHAIPYSDSDIELINSVENDAYGLGGGMYWRN